MHYQGRRIDPVALWGRYVEFPPGYKPGDVFLPKVQCPNPSHDTLKKHFQVNAEQPLVHCFANCGISGTYEHAICVIEGLYDKFHVEDAPSAREQRQRKRRAQREAQRIILRGARPGGISRPLRRRDSPRPASPLSADELRYESLLPAAGLEYLEARGISAESLAAWRIGWDAEQKRIVIPAHDERGVLRFLIKRACFESQQPKYLYTAGFPKTSLVFGICNIDPGMIKSDGLVLVEGSIDTILNHQHGLRTTAGILGTGISELQRRIIARINPPRIFLMFDKDSAGIRNVEIAASMLRKYPLYVVRYPKGASDPAEMSAAEKERQIARAIPLYQFYKHPSVKRRKEFHG